VLQESCVLMLALTVTISPSLTATLMRRYLAAADERRTGTDGSYFWLDWQPHAGRGCVDGFFAAFSLEGSK